MTAPGTIQFDPSTLRLNCGGDWDLNTLPVIQAELEAVAWPEHGELTIDGKAISKLDTAGAWLLGQLQNRDSSQQLKVRLENFSEAHQSLVEQIKKQLDKEEPIPHKTTPNGLAQIGRYTAEQTSEFHRYLIFIGQLTYDTLRVLRHPSHIRWREIASTVQTAGFNALPIIALLSLMIGVVLTYQMGLQLRNYGANIYIVNLLGLAVLREFGPLITAIMIAGRTGSAFTAQLGTMKLKEEIDALTTMGVPPNELLILPRIIGLLIALPLLTIWADIFGVLGGILMSKNMLDIGWYNFLHRFEHVIPLRALIIGIGKTPIFALIIATIGCFQGTCVELSADSVGKKTTRSVVLAIFFILVADAAFSVIFSKLKL